MTVAFSQIDKQFDVVKASAINALKSIFPVEGKLRSIVMQEAWVDDKADPTDYKAQSDAKQNESTWGVPVYAHLKMIDKSGRVIDENPKIRLFNLPKPTQRHSYIVNGNEYQVQHQLRLKSGVYTLRKQNGELKTQINLSRGKNFDIGFDEQKGVFFIQKVAGGQANITLYPILTYMGISRAEIAKQWGEKVTASNEASADPRAVEKLETAIGLKRNVDLKNYLATTAISPDTTKAILGKSFEKIDGLLLLAASKNLLDVHMGKEEATDRDSLEYKEVHSIDDFLKERLEKNSDNLAFKIKRSIDNLKRTKLSQIVSPAAFTKEIETFFTQDDKSSTPDQTNPLEMLSGTTKITLMGAGGIGSTHSLTPEMRQVHSSQLGLIDPIHSPEGDRVGVNMHVPLGAVKDGNTLKLTVIDQSGKEQYIDAIAAKNKKIAFPGQTGSPIKAMYKGQIIEIPKSEADFFIKNSSDMYTWSTNLVPFLPSAQGNRAMMAAKMMEQAISLKHREAPLVQSLSPNGRTFEEVIGDQATVKSPVNGTVKSITSDDITINTSGGDIKVNLYNNFTLNRKSFISNNPIVKVGDIVKKGQLIADSNYTKNGVLALGTNLKTAYVPFRGYNFDDGIVISESASTKLISEHIYKKELPLFENTQTGLNLFRNTYPNTLAPTNFSKLDSDGVIKKGETIQHGEVLIAALQKRIISKDVAIVSRVLSERPKDISMYWTLEDSGKVIDVIKSPTKITVIIKTEEAAKIGDKLAGRHGNKGVITKIIPDHEMPHDAKSQPMDILLNPMGIISRINISQTFESAAAKVANKTGSTIKVKNFDGTDNLKFVKGLQDKSDTPDKEELFDPTTGKSLGQVHVGMPHILKLFKQSQGNYSVRQGGPGHGYDANMQPTKAGGEEGSKSLDVLTMYSMLSHGARENLREMASIKSTKNDEYWTALKSGEMLPPPKQSFAFDKFVSYLKGAGIDVKKQGTAMALAPFTDKQVKDQSALKIEEPVFHRAKDFEPIRGGFFDSTRLGGFKGTRWGHMELAEPVINPTFENAVRKLTGLGTKFDSIIDGKIFVNANNELNKEGDGVTGGKAIEQLLKNINVDDELKKLKEKAKKTKGNNLDDINKKIKYLTSLKTLNLKPEEAYMRNYLPIVPPQFRPIYPLPDGNITSSDINYLYRDTGVVNKMMKLPVMDLLADKHKAEIRSDLYNYVKGVTGLTDINIQGKPRDGFISEIKGGTGGQPKEGFFISKLLSKQQDYVGRGTIIPESTLGIDEMAMPEPMAWKLFEPFIIRELKTHGKTPIQAMEEIKQKTSLARSALDKVMEKRHVLLNRAPSLHKYSIMAFKPKITDGKALKIPPLVNKGFNADHDGDTMTVHVPISEEANAEAAKMLPSKNLFQPGTGKLMIVPSQEAQIGIYYLSQTDAGRAQINKITGPKFPVTGALNKGAAAALLTKIAEEATSQDFADIVHKLKSIGEKHAYDTGFTVGINDLHDFSKERNALVNSANKMVAAGEDPQSVHMKSTALIDLAMKHALQNKGNPLYDQIESGARGDPSQLRQIMFSPMFVKDGKGKIISSPISKSYSEGLSMADYWKTSYNARKGTMDRALSTSLPGAFSKDIMNTTIENVISKNDCGTKDGIVLPVVSHDILDRFLAGDQVGHSHNTLIDGSLQSELKKKGIASIKVRSPLKCLVAKGTCAHCYGLDEHKHIPDVGENVGAKAGQSISEPLIQITMNSFHTGGAIGTGTNAEGFSRINQLLTVPKVLTGAAALAPISGKITKITKGIAGGYDVHIGDNKTHIALGLKPLISVGDEIEKGDRLSEGPIKPQELTELKGVEHTQKYLTDELQRTYKSQGVGISRKTFETVVRSLTNLTQVTKPPEGSSWNHGDIIPLSVANHYNNNLIEEVATGDAVGLKLADGVGSLRAGHILTQGEANSIESNGVHTVKIIKDGLEHKPFLKSIQTLPLQRQDWMAALGYRNLSKVLTEGAAQGWQTDIEGYHPIPALAHGITFGKGKEGRY